MPSEKSSIAVAISLPEAFAVACKASSPIVVRAKHRTSGVEQTFTAQPPFVFIGRSPAAGICLVDPSVSQCHAYLQIVEGAVYCIDIGSRTGVIWEDGSRSRGWVRPNQTLRMGAFDVWVDAG